MRLYLNFILIYSISNKWILVESGESSTSKTGVDLNLTSQAATNEFDYKIDLQYVTYLAKGNNAFKAVKDGTTEVWKANNANDYSTRVEVDLMNYDSKAVTIYFDDDKTKLFKKDGSDKPWKEIDLTKVTPKKVNIGFPHETYIWKHDSHDNCRTFTARKGLAFNVVSESAQGSTVEIWKTDKANEYANKIELVDKKMTIHIGEGTSASTKVFEKGTDGKWTEDTNSSKKGSGTTGSGGGTTPASPTSGGTNQSSGVTSGSTQDSKTGSEQSSSTPAAGTGSQQPSGQPSSGKGSAGSQSQSSSSATQPQDSPTSQSQSKDSPTSQSQSKDSPTSQSQSKDSPTSQSQSQTGKSQSSSSTSPSSTSGPSGKRDTSGQPAGTQGGGGGPPKGGSQQPSTTPQTGVTQGASSPPGKTGSQPSSTTPAVPSGQPSSTSSDPGTASGTSQSGEDTENQASEAAEGGPVPEGSGSASTESSADGSTNKTGVDLDILSDSSTDNFDYGRFGQYVTYIPKRDNAFKLVNEDNSNIWQASDASEYSGRVELDLMNYDAKAVTVFLGDNKNKIYMKSGKNDPWKEIDTTNVNPEEVNIDYPCESYFYKHELNGYYRTFTAKKGFAFKNVIEYINNNKIEIWKTDQESEYVNKIEVDSLANDGKAFAIYLPGNKTRVFIRNRKSEPWKEIDLSKVNPKPVNINYTHQSYFYKNELRGETRTFTAKEGFMFNHARFFPKNTWVDIWKTANQTEYANKIEVEGGKKVTIYLADGSTKVIEKGSDGKWPVDTSGQGTGRGPSGEEVASTGTDQSGSRATASGEGKMAEGSDSTSSGSPADGSTNKTGVDLNIKSDKKSNKNLEYEKVGEYATYTAKDNNAFKLVKEDATNIWEATNSNEYSTKVEVDLMVEIKVVTIHLSGNKTKVFKKDVDNNCWTTIDTSRVNAVSININYPYETYFYKDELNGSYRTFTAKTGFAIKGAHEYVNRSKVEVWNTDNESEYVNKIEVDLMNNDAKALTVYMAGNKTRVFKKDGMSEPWKEIDTNNVNPKPVNINYPYECYFYQNKLQDNFRTFTAKKGFAFKNVIEYINNNKIEIWKTDNDNEYVNKIDIDLMNNDSKAVTFYMRNNTTRIFMRSGMNGAWNEIDTTKVNAKSVNIQYTYDCHYYINSLDNDVRTFTAKKGFMFNHARCFVDNDWLDIWKTDNESEYANKIEVEGAKKVTIYLANGSTKVIEKGSDGKWPVDTSGQGTGRGPSVESTSS